MKQGNQFGYTFWAAGIILCLLASVFALFFASCAKQRPAEEETGKNGFTVETEPSPGGAGGEGAEESPPVSEETPAVTPVRLAETADAGHGYLDRFVFLGDSTTYGIGYYYDRGYTDLCPPNQVWTPANGTLTLSNYKIATIVYPETGEEIPIEEAVARAKPEYLMITLGVNGVSFMDEEWFIQDYTALVELVRQASPDTKIILNSIYPVAASYQYQNDINNEKIRAANGWIERIAEDTGVRFLNSFESMVGEDGYLSEESQTDGIHLTGEAFGKVMKYIRTHEYR